MLTADGIGIAIFYTKIYNRLLVPLTAADQPQAYPSSAPHCPQSTDMSTITSPRTTTSPGRMQLDSNVKPAATKDR